VGCKGGSGGKVGEMTQTSYAYMNKRKKNTHTGKKKRKKKLGAITNQ
jgi:hypothetical protein